MLADLAQISNHVFASGLFVDELMHGIIATPFALLLWNKSRSWRHVALFYAVAYFIDLDHFVDHWMFLGGIDIRLVEFFQLEFFKVKETGILPAHGWEWSAILLFIGWRRDRWHSYIFAIGLAVFAHLLWDSVSNGLGFAFYSFFWRASRGFAFPHGV